MTGDQIRNAEANRYRPSIPGRDAVIKVLLAAVVIALVFNFARGGGERQIAPEFQPRDTTNQLALPDPVSGVVHYEADGRNYLIAMTKADNEHIEAAYLRIISVEPGEQMKQVGRIHTSMSIQTPPSAIAVASGHVYVGLAREGVETPALWVVDISNLQRPFEANLLRADIPIRSLTASENGYLVASGYGEEFLVYDISQPNEPEKTATFSLPVAAAPQLELHESTLIVNHMAGVMVIDMSRPDQPQRIASFDHPEWIEPLFRPAPGEFLTGEEGFDINVPSGNYLDFTVGDHLMLASGDDGLTVLDISDASSVRLATEVPIRGRTISVGVMGGNAIVLSAEPRADERAQFSLLSVELSDLDRPVVREIAQSIVGLPRYQRVISSDDNVWIVFNGAILRPQILDQ